MVLVLQFVVGVVVGGVEGLFGEEESERGGRRELGMYGWLVGVFFRD